MNEQHHDNLRTLLENPEHYEQALELVEALNADEVLSAAMADTELQHWMALFEAAQARSEETLLAGLAHSAGLHETAPHLLEGLKSEEDAARCRRGIAIAVLQQDFIFDEGLEDELADYWQPITTPEEAEQVCAAMTQDWRTWEHFSWQLGVDGWGKQLVYATLTSPLSEDEDVLNVLVNRQLDEGLDSFFLDHPKTVWSSLLDWHDGLELLSPDVVKQLVCANLDDPKVVQALIANIDNETETKERLLQALSEPHPEESRLVIVEHLRDHMGYWRWQPRIPPQRLLAVIAAAPGDATLLPIMRMVHEEYEDIDEDTPDAPSPEACRQALNTALLQRIVDLQTRQECGIAARFLQPPFSVETVRPVLISGVVPAVCALLVRLQETKSTAFFGDLYALANDELQSAISATAAEQLGLMWDRLYTDADVSSHCDPLGLVMAAAMANDEDCLDELVEMGHDPDWALALTRVALHRDWFSELRPGLIATASESKIPVAGDWLDALGMALFHQPMEEGSISRWRRAQINALGTRAVDLVVAALAEKTEETWPRKLFMLCGRASHLLDIAPRFDEVVAPHLPKQKSWSAWSRRPSVVKERWLGAIREYIGRLSTDSIADALSDPRRLSAALHVLPKTLDEVLTDTLAEWLETDAHGGAAAAVLMSRSLPAAGRPVASAILQDPARLPAGLRLLAGSGPIDPDAEFDHCSEALHDLLIDPPPERVAAVRRSRLWRRALLCAPQPLPELCPPQPESIVALAEVIQHPHAQVAAAALIHRKQYALREHLIAAFEAAEYPLNRTILRSVVAENLRHADAKALHQASTPEEIEAALGLPESLLDARLDEEELTVRTSTILARQNIETFRDLTGYTEGQLLKLKNFGRKSLNELRHIMEKRGLTFAPADEK